MFSRVVEGADPYRGIEKPCFSSPPRGYANNETDSRGRLSLQGFKWFSFICAKPKNRANNVTAGASPRPTNVDQYSACSRKIERKTLFIVGTDVLGGPLKQTARTKQYGDARFQRLPQSLRDSSPSKGKPLVKCKHRLKPWDSAKPLFVVGTVTSSPALFITLIISPIGAIFNQYYC